jgi:hypothetical protein
MLAVDWPLRPAPGAYPTLDRETARALVHANLMSYREYFDKFATAEERLAGSIDSIRVVRD